MSTMNRIPSWVPTVILGPLVLMPLGPLWLRAIAVLIAVLAGWYGPGRRV